MAYCGANDIRRALTGSATAGGGPPDPPTNTAADLDDEALNDSAEEASAIVDSYIDGPYDTTADKIPPVVRFWTRDIAAYLATLVWRRSKAPAANDPVVLRFNTALDMLKEVADGALTILGPVNVDDQPTVVTSILTPFAGSLFTPNDFDLTGRMAGYPGWPLYYWNGFLLWSTEEAAEA